MPKATTTRTLSTLVLALAAAPAVAQTIPPGPPPDWGHDFVTIGAPGNRGVTPAEAPNWDFDRFGPFGGVDYEFRITRTEVTNAQYFEFVDTYTKVPGFHADGGMFGLGLVVDGYDPLGRPIVVILPGAEHAPANPTWEFAARYTNWLHHGKGVDLADFETGVYDTSTFGVDPVTGKRTDQLERSPGARYFLPTLDEWTKAAYYDPDRYGADQEGYWYYPGASDDPLVSGLPGEPGAETGVGQQPTAYPLSFPVGSYPDTAGPWGVLDTSGGLREWSETVPDSSHPARYRFVLGSETHDMYGTLLNDRLDDVQADLPGFQGFRVASIVPAPGVGIVIVMAALAGGVRRRRMDGSALGDRCARS